LLILHSGCTFRQAEIDLSQVHAHRLWNHSFEQFHCEVKRKAISFIRACRLEFCGVNSIDVK
jgi:hypothetical protein